MFVCVSALAFPSAVSHVAGPVSMCTFVAYLCLCGYLLGIDAQPHYSLDEGTWRCSNLASIWLLHLATPNVFVANSMNAKKQ